jgi:hypothetical protein
MDDHSILLKQSVPFIVFQWSNELGQNMWIIFRINCLLKERWSHNEHQTPIFDEFQVLNVGFQHSVLYCFDY